MLVVKTMIHVASVAGNFCSHIMGTVSQAVIPGSKINFLIWAPTDEQVYISGRQRANIGHQKFPLSFLQIKV